MTEKYPATILQKHNNAALFLSDDGNALL